MTRILRQLSQTKESVSIEAFLYGMASTLDFTGTMSPPKSSPSFSYYLMEMAQPEAQLEASLELVGQALLAAINDEETQKESGRSGAE